MRRCVEYSLADVGRIRNWPTKQMRGKAVITTGNKKDGVNEHAGPSAFAANPYLCHHRLVNTEFTVLLLWYEWCWQNGSGVMTVSWEPE